MVSSSLVENREQAPLDKRSKDAALIELRNVCVVRGEKAALDDFSLRIDLKEHVAILGPNGCGKSTLIKTITRECYPVAREGSWMRILDRERWNIFELRSLLGIVSNDLLAWCKADTPGREVVLSGFFSSQRVFRNHHVSPEQERLASKALDRLGVLHLAERPMEEMSSGEAQRVLIARALVHEPKALVFDEPTNSLDVLAQHELRQTMRDLAQSGVGVVLVTHHVADIIPEIERVVLMRDGRLVADGRKQDLLSSGQLSRLFGMRLEISERGGQYHVW
jgi:iron complex transport system ATP-binding protein